MLTDCASQFEMKGVNDIPKSFQKLINEIQSVKKNKNQSKNSSTSLDIKTIKKPTTIKKKKKPRKPKPLDTDLDDNFDESSRPKDSVQILNQTNITEFFNTIKTNLANRYAGENLRERKNQDAVPKVDQEIILSDDDQLFYSGQNQNPASDLKKSDFSLSGYQNPDYLNYLSSRNDNFNSIIERDRFESTTASGGTKSNHQTAQDDSWKTFNEISTSMDCDFSIERKKNITPNTFYSCNKSNMKTQSKIPKKINQPDSLLKRNQDDDITTINYKAGPKNISKDWLSMLKDDQEKMANLLNQVKSMNDIITKSTQDISKFFLNRN